MPAYKVREDALEMALSVVRGGFLDEAWLASQDKAAPVKNFRNAILGKAEIVCNLLPSVFDFFVFVFLHYHLG